MQGHIILFAKAPLPGFAKTRLIPALGATGAADLAQAMLRHAAAQAVAAQTGPVELCVWPEPADPCWSDAGLDHIDVTWSDQGEGDLGTKMARAAKRVLANGHHVLLMGGDCPALDAGSIRAAAGALLDADCVIIPAKDGGYVLIGMRKFDEFLFSDIAWSTPSVAAQTIRRISTLGWTLKQFAPLADIDDPSDLADLPMGFACAVDREAAFSKARLSEK